MRQQINNLIIEALHEIISNPVHDEKQLELYFNPSYQQIVDGKELDYQEFVKHVAFLKANTKSMNVSILSSVSEGNTVFTHHLVSVEKEKGEQSEFEVLARFTLLSNKIIRCEELTRLVIGSSSDHDLGSRN